jgi:hypothetical protein
VNPLQIRYADLNKHEVATLAKVCAVLGLDPAKLNRQTCLILLSLFYNVTPVARRRDPGSMSGQLVVAAMVLRTLHRVEFGNLTDPTAIDDLLAQVDELRGELDRLVGELTFGRNRITKNNGAAREDDPLQDHSANEIVGEDGGAQA